MQVSITYFDHQSHYAYMQMGFMHIIFVHYTVGKKHSKRTVGKNNNFSIMKQNVAPGGGSNPGPLIRVLRVSTAKGFQPIFR